MGPTASLAPEQVQQSYESVLTALEGQLQESLFLFGSRPSLAEFGLHGQLTQYAGDPFVSRVMKDNAVRVFQWEQFMDDLSGIEGEWAAPEDCLTDELGGIIASLAQGYFTMMATMRQAVDVSDLAGALNGQRYRVKCLLALKAELARLDEGDRNLIRPILEAVARGMICNLRRAKKRTSSPSRWPDSSLTACHHEVLVDPVDVDCVKNCQASPGNRELDDCSLSSVPTTPMRCELSIGVNDDPIVQCIQWIAPVHAIAEGVVADQALQLPGHLACDFAWNRDELQIGRA